MSWKNRIQYSLLCSVLVLAGCGSSAGSAQESSFGAWSWIIPEGYSYEKISGEDIGDAATMTQGFTKSTTDGREGVLVVMTVGGTYLDSTTLKAASTTSNQRLLGYHHIDNDTVTIDCGEMKQQVTTSRFSFLRSPLSKEKYYVIQAYLVSTNDAVIISLLTEESKDTKNFIKEFEEITCKE